MSRSARYDGDITSWLIAFAIACFLSLLVAGARLFSSPIFTIEFEVCIFYVPTTVLAVIFAKMHQGRISPEF
ncbi:MAG: hypothetical protein V1857_07290 [archaeon]